MTAVSPEKLAAQAEATEETKRLVGMIHDLIRNAIWNCVEHELWEQTEMLLEVRKLLENVIGTAAPINYTTTDDRIGEGLAIIADVMSWASDSAAGRQNQLAWARRAAHDLLHGREVEEPPRASEAE